MNSKQNRIFILRPKCAFGEKHTQYWRAGKVQDLIHFIQTVQWLADRSIADAREVTDSRQASMTHWSRD